MCVWQESWQPVRDKFGVQRAQRGKELAAADKFHVFFKAKLFEILEKLGT